jgi:aminopeptidase YwaD
VAGGNNSNSATVAATTTASTPQAAASTEAPVPQPTLQLTKTLTDTVTALALGPAETALKATGFSGDEAKQWLDELAKFGSRPVGSDGLQKTADWLENRYKSLGFTQVTRQDFPFAVPEQRTAVIFTGDKPDRDTTKTQGLLLSKPQKVQFQATTVYYAPGAAVQGKIVILTSGGEYTQQKGDVSAIAKAGAAAVLIPRLGMQPDFTTFGDIDIPVVVIPFNTIANLEPLPNGANYTMQTSYVPANKGTATNIIATRPGSKATAPILIFGSHYDSVPNTLAANANASGTVVTLELAKTLFTKFPDYELRFINFSAEETGLTGSFYYVSKLSADDKNRVATYIDLNQLGVGNDFIASGTKELVDKAVAVASQNNIKLQAFELGSTGVASDFAAFQQNNIKTLFLGRWQDSEYHKAGDTPDRIFGSTLLLAGGTAILIAQKLVAGQ